jgi:hypothetical protein
MKSGDAKLMLLSVLITAISMCAGCTYDSAHESGYIKPVQRDDNAPDERRCGDLNADECNMQPAPTRSENDDEPKYRSYGRNTQL